MDRKERLQGIVELQTALGEIMKMGTREPTEEEDSSKDIQGMPSDSLILSLQFDAICILGVQLKQVMEC